MLFSKELTVADLVERLREKFKEYPHVYLFGKENGSRRKEMSLKDKRKNPSSS
jgi:hypothetical protein